MSDNKIPIVIDTGSSSTKAGFSVDKAPRVIFPTAVGRPVHAGLLGELNLKKVYVGEEALCKRGILNLCYPKENGTVNSWEDMEHIWHHSFHKELLVSPEEHPVLLTEQTSNNIYNREKMAQIMFETFNIPAIYLGNQVVLSLYASGRTSGIVLDSGYSVSHFVPIYEGRELSDEVKRIDLAGGDLTDYLSKMLAERGYVFSTSAEREIVRDIKEMFGYVALDFQKEMTVTSSSSSDKTYQLPDGQVITIGNERFRCPEVMFRPSLIGMDSPGIHQIIVESIMKSDLDIRCSFYSNIVLAGGNMMYPGLKQRLQNEITALKRTPNPVKIVTFPNSHYSAWLGGVCVAELGTTHADWLTREEYNSIGQDVVKGTFFF